MKQEEIYDSATEYTDIYASQIDKLISILSVYSDDIKNETPKPKINEETEVVHYQSTTFVNNFDTLLDSKYCTFKSKYNNLSYSKTKLDTFSEISLNTLSKQMSDDKEKNKEKTN